MEDYAKRHPEVSVDRDYFVLKVTEEWGECVQSYMMNTGRAREKGKTQEELRDEFEKEFADVFGFLVLFAQQQNIDIEKALEKKWFKHLA